MLKSGSSKDDAAGYVNEIARGNEVAKDAKDQRHRFAGKNIPGKENARENGEKSHLHCFSLRVCFAGNQNPQRKGDKQIRQREKREQQYAAMNRNTEGEAHGSYDEAQFKKADRVVRKNLPEK